MRRGFAGAFVLAAVLSSAADPVALNVKPGLWETTTTVDGFGARRTGRTCRETDQAFRPFLNEDIHQCRQTIVSSTAKRQEIKIECPMPQRREIWAAAEAKDPEHVKGSVLLRVEEGRGHPRDLNMQMTAVWLGESCGDLGKP